MWGMNTDNVILLDKLQTVKSCFDDYDAFCLANRFTPIQLRKIIQVAESHFDDLGFDWLGFADCCREALTYRCMAKLHHKPSHINIADLKARVDIVLVISRYVELKKMGRNFTALCPFHSEKTPSFYVNPERQTWHCFGACGTGGDVISFIMRVEDCSFREAVEILGGVV